MNPFGRPIPMKHKGQAAHSLTDLPVQVRENDAGSNPLPPDAGPLQPPFFLQIEWNFLQKTSIIPIVTTSTTIPFSMLYNTNKPKVVSTHLP